jgi:hypothetical protein
MPSRGANAYLGLVLPSSVTDRTSGYRAHRSEVLHRIVFDEDRPLGRSKRNSDVVIEAIWRPWLLLRLGAVLRPRR